MVTVHSSKNFVPFYFYYFSLLFVDNLLIYGCTQEGKSLSLFFSPPVRSFSIETSQI